MANRCSHFPLADYKNNPLASLSISSLHLSHLSPKPGSCDSCVNGNLSAGASDAELQLPSRPVPSGGWRLMVTSLRTWIVSVILPLTHQAWHSTPTSIWHIGSEWFPWEAKGLTVCYFQTRKSCWCALARQNWKVWKFLSKGNVSFKKSCSGSRPSNDDSCVCGQHVYFPFWPLSYLEDEVVRGWVRRCYRFELSDF